MNESEWLTSTDARALLDHLFSPAYCLNHPPVSRKLRLYLCALCRAAWDRLPAACRAATVFAERLEDTRWPDPSGRQAVAIAAGRMINAFTKPEIVAQCERDLRAVGLEVSAGPPWRGTAEEWTRYTRLAYVPHWTSMPPLLSINHRPDLIYCVFGNPFRPAALDPRWRTRTATDLARAMYESRDFSAMPVLADALEEAGCDGVDVLAHCRADSPHARGCWVVDHVLGK